jgi:hypothetical protein
MTHQEHAQTIVNQSLLANPCLAFKPGDQVIVCKPPSKLLKTTTDGPLILLNQIGNRIWRAAKLQHNSLVLTTHEYPVAWLKHYRPSSIVEGLPNAPPTSRIASDQLIRNDMVIILDKHADTKQLHVGRIQSNDPDNKRIFLQLYSPNRLGEFFSTEIFRYIPWDQIVAGKFKLQSRTIPENIQQAILTFLGGVM